MEESFIGGQVEKLIQDLTAAEIQRAIKQGMGWYDIHIPEFTFEGIRIDAAVVNLSKRQIRGYEIKVSRSDWKSDKKWTLYSQFCSHLSVVCPAGLIDPEEISKPFGLLWVEKEKNRFILKWKKRPQHFQSRDSLAWLWTYIKVIEKELPRLDKEADDLRKALAKRG